MGLVRDSGCRECFSRVWHSINNKCLRGLLGQAPREMLSGQEGLWPTVSSSFGLERFGSGRLPNSVSLTSGQRVRRVFEARAPPCCPRRRLFSSRSGATRSSSRSKPMGLSTRSTGSELLEPHDFRFALPTQSPWRRIYGARRRPCGSCWRSVRFPHQYLSLPVVRVMTTPCHGRFSHGCQAKSQRREVSLTPMTSPGMLPNSLEHSARRLRGAAGSPALGAAGTFPTRTGGWKRVSARARSCSTCLSSEPCGRDSVPCRVRRPTS